LGSDPSLPLAGYCCSGDAFGHALGCPRAEGSGTPGHRGGGGQEHGGHEQAGGPQEPVAAPAQEAESTSSRRRRRSSAGSGRDISERMEAKFKLEIDTAKKDIANVTTTLEHLEQTVEGTKRMVMEGNPAAGPARLEEQPQKSAAEPAEEFGARSSRRRRRQHKPHYAPRVRRVVKALDKVQQELDNIELRMAKCERLTVWTRAKIANPNIKDFDDSPAADDEDDEEVDEDEWEEDSGERGWKADKLPPKVKEDEWEEDSRERRWKADELPPKASHGRAGVVPSERQESRTAADGRRGHKHNHLDSQLEEQLATILEEIKSISNKLVILQNGADVTRRSYIQKIGNTQRGVAYNW